MRVENSSGIHPLGTAVLVEYHNPERKDSVIVIPDSFKDRVNAVEQRALVVECGSEAWAKESKPRARPGDYVLISKMSGYACYGKDGKPYRLVNDRDVFAAISDPEAVYG